MPDLSELCQRRIWPGVFHLYNPHKAESSGKFCVTASSEPVRAEMNGGNLDFPGRKQNLIHSVINSGSLFLLLLFAP